MTLLSSPEHAFLFRFDGFHSVHDMTAPEIWLVLTVGVDPRGYFLVSTFLIR